MKTSNSKTEAQKLAGDVKLARDRVAMAETKFKAARQRARLAKRRRKEVKLIARRARKEAKQAKAALAEAKQALAEIEAKLARFSRRAAGGKRAKSRPTAKAAAAAHGKRVKPVRPATSPAPEPETLDQFASDAAPAVAAQHSVTPPDFSTQAPPGGAV